MPDTTSFDLAKLDAWCGVRPGMTRAEVQAAMQRQGVEVEEYGDDNLSAMADDWEMEFYFTTDGSQRLRQLSIDDAKVLWNGKPLLGVRMGDAMQILGSPAAAAWRPGDASSRPFPDASAEPEQPVTDEQLLEEGTIWLPDRGLGLVVSEGEVVSVVWRNSVDLPQQFAGPVTDAQRVLSKRGDLEEYLREKRSERFQSKVKKDPLTPWRTLVTLATIAALGFVGKKGFEEMKIWNQAPTLTSKLVAFEKVPLKQFRDYVMPQLRWIFPRTRTVMVEAYRVEFTAPHEDTPQQAVLERGEVYVSPEKPGDEVPVVHVAGNPPRTKGLFRARDSAFVDFVPSAIAIGVLWLLVQAVLSCLPFVFRKIPGLIKRLAPSGVVKDVNRPELR